MSCNYKHTQEHQIRSFIFYILKDWKRIMQGWPSFLCYWTMMAFVPQMMFQPTCWGTQMRARAPGCWVEDEGESERSRGNLGQGCCCRPDSLVAESKAKLQSWSPDSVHHSLCISIYLEARCNQESPSPAPPAMTCKPWSESLPTLTWDRLLPLGLISSYLPVQVLLTLWGPEHKGKINSCVRQEVHRS